MTTPAEREALQEQGDSAEVYRLTFGGVDYFFTSYFESQTIDGDTYEAMPVQRGGLGLKADLSDVETTIAIPAASTIGQLFLGELQIQSATVEIRKYFLADLTQYLVVFAGYIKRSNADGGVVSLSCSSWLDPASREVPRVRVQKKCNLSLFSTHCGLLASSWKITAEVTYIAGRKITVSYTLPLGYPTYKQRNEYSGEFVAATPPVQGFFTQGKCCKAGTSDMRHIVSEATNATSAVLTLHYPIRGLEVGDDVDLYCGCNKTFDQGLESSSCINSCSSFSNTDNFLGMEAIPYKNPTITPVQI